MLQLLDEPAVELTETLATHDDRDDDSPDGFTKARVAELSSGRITAMSTADMARAVRDVSVLQFCDPSRLEFLDRPTLERLVFLARQCCRNQGY
ncbi:MAG TPA: hypothetical protein VML55_22975 [Planctomycetaceae bacterium]|nr:hypothetical protein [Planctomycetaceae bacterium]